ncbi:hypothetical protein D9M70_457990 [compost metagenome]
MHLALVVHRRRHGERLAATAGAIVEHLFAFLRKGEIGNDLRAFVLDFEPALLKGKLRRHVRQARGAFAGRNANAVAGDRRRFGAAALQRLQHLGARGLQRIGTQVERRPAGEGLRFIEPIVGEVFLEGGLDPFGNVALDVGCGVFEAARGEGLRHLG